MLQKSILSPYFLLIFLGKRKLSALLGGLFDMGGLQQCQSSLEVMRAPLQLRPHDGILARLGQRLRPGLLGSLSRLSKFFLQLGRSAHVVWPCHLISGTDLFDACVAGESSTVLTRTHASHGRCSMAILKATARSSTEAVRRSPREREDWTSPGRGVFVCRAMAQASVSGWRIRSCFCQSGGSRHTRLGRVEQKALLIEVDDILVVVEAVVGRRSFGRLAVYVSREASVPAFRRRTLLEAEEGRGWKGIEVSIREVFVDVGHTI